MRWLSALLIIPVIYAYQTPTPEVLQVSPTPSPQVQEVVVERDTREDSLKAYLLSKKSPLADFATHFVRTADTWGLDYTLLPAIAGVESGFETMGNTTDHNPFGYMCSGRPCRFVSFDEAITRVGRSLGEGRAYTKFQSTGSILELAKKYNYVSPEDWSGKVGYFQKQIKESTVNLERR